MKLFIRSIAFTFILAATACSSGPDIGPSAAGDSPAASDAGNQDVPGELVDPCTLLTDDEIETITGDSPESTRSATVTDAFKVCHWSDGGEDLFTLTIQTDHDWNLLTQVAAARGDEKYRELPGVGDRAFVALEADVVAESGGIAVTAQGQEETISDLENIMVLILDRLG